MTVPLIGWSLAAQNFRVQAAINAKRPVSVLLVGAHGVGKRAMANMWRQVAGVDSKELPSVDLDDDKVTMPRRCIGLTTRCIQTTIVRSNGKKSIAPADGVLPIHLETGSACIPPNTDSELRPLPKSVAGKFMIRYYMPPLVDRSIDILAIVHAFCTTSGVTGFRTISSRLIHRLLLDVSLWANASSLIEYLQLRAADSKRYLADHTEHTGFDAIFSPKGRPFASRQNQLNWECDDIPILIERLPRVAMQILLDRFLNSWAASADEKQGLFPSRNVDEPSSPLGSVRLWRRHKYWDRLDSRLETATPAELLNAQSMELSGGSEIHAELSQGLSAFRCMGATVSSIQSGLSVRSADLQEIYEWMPKTPVPKKRRNRLKSVEPSKRQLKAYMLCEAHHKTLAEAAIAMNCTKENVRKLLERCKEKLAAKPEAGRSVRAKYKVEDWDQDDQDSRPE